MLPNRFPDEGQAPEYNTVDATLWYFEAIRAYHAATGDTDLVRDLYPVLQEIVDWHLRGTRYHIHIDPADGLLYGGEPGMQLTWMDAKASPVRARARRVGDPVVMPRIGRPGGGKPLRIALGQLPAYTSRHGVIVAERGA